MGEAAIPADPGEVPPLGSGRPVQQLSRMKPGPGPQRRPGVGQEPQRLDVVCAFRQLADELETRVPLSLHGTGWSDSDAETRLSEAGVRPKIQQSIPEPATRDHRHAGLPGGLGSPTRGARSLTAQATPLGSVLGSGWKAGLLFSLGPAGAASSPRWNLTTFRGCVLSRLNTVKRRTYTPKMNTR